MQTTAGRNYSPWGMYNILPSATTMLQETVCVAPQGADASKILPNTRSIPHCAPIVFLAGCRRGTAHNREDDF